MSYLLPVPADVSADLPADPPFIQVQGLLPAEVWLEIMVLISQGFPEAAAGLRLRWAKTVSRKEADRVLLLVSRDYDKLTSEQWAEAEQRIKDQCLLFYGNLDAISPGAFLSLSALEELTIQWDRLCSARAYFKLFSFDIGERQFTHICRMFLEIRAAQLPAGPFSSPLLALMARRGLGPWTVAPGEIPPSLDPDCRVGPEDDVVAGLMAELTGEVDLEVDGPTEEMETQPDPDPYPYPYPWGE